MNFWVTMSCFQLNPIALRKAKTHWNFGRSECNRVKHFNNLVNKVFVKLLLQDLYIKHRVIILTKV